MHGKKRALLAAGLLAGAAAMTGCTANTTPVNTPTPQAAQQQTAQPATAQPTAEATAEAAVGATEEPAGEETPGPLALTVGGKETEEDAILEEDGLLLPLEATAQMLGWKTDSQQTEEETQTRRVITLEKDDSRITVSWTVSDNTTKGVTWQKDGLLIPVDTKIAARDGVVYVPAAFFEEAMDVTVSETNSGVVVSTPKPMETPQTMEESSGENG